MEPAKNARDQLSQDQRSHRCRCLRPKDVEGPFQATTSLHCRFLQGPNLRRLRRARHSQSVFYRICLEMHLAAWNVAAA